MQGNGMLYWNIALTFHLLDWFLTSAKPTIVSGLICCEGHLNKALRLWMPPNNFVNLYLKSCNVELFWGLNITATRLNKVYSRQMLAVFSQFHNNVNYSCISWCLCSFLEKREEVGHVPSNTTQGKLCHVTVSFGLFYLGVWLNATLSNILACPNFAISKRCRDKPPKTYLINCKILHWRQHNNGNNSVVNNTLI